MSFYLRYSHFNKQFEKIQMRSCFIYIDGVAIIINIVIMHAITDGDDGVCHVMENQGSTRRKWQLCNGGMKGSRKTHCITFKQTVIMLFIVKWVYWVSVCIRFCHFMRLNNIDLQTIYNCSLAPLYHRDNSSFKMLLYSAKYLRINMYRGSQSLVSNTFLQIYGQWMSYRKSCIPKKHICLIITPNPTFPNPTFDIITTYSCRYFSKNHFFFK